MLVDLKVSEKYKEQYDKAVKKLTDEGVFDKDRDNESYYGGNPIYHTRTGVYQNPMDDCNFRYECFEDFAYQPFPIEYGVADDLDQIMAFLNPYINDKNKRYVISWCRIYQDKENAGKGGGWRWHKWGGYIGTLEPKCEYLDDEDFGPDFQGYVICWDLYEVPDKNQNE